MNKRIFTRTIGVAAVAAMAAVLPASGANAITTRADLSLTTTATMTATSLQICATVSFTGGIFENSTLVLTSAGIDETTNNQVPLADSPISTDFTPSQTVCTTYSLQAGSTVHADWNAQAVGLAPTPFTGECTGTITRVNGGTPLVVKTC